MNIGFVVAVMVVVVVLVVVAATVIVVVIVVNTCILCTILIINTGWAKKVSLLIFAITVYCHCQPIFIIFDSYTL